MGNDYFGKFGRFSVSVRLTFVSSHELYIFVPF